MSKPPFINMPCELVSCVTSDGIRLHGAWHSSRKNGPLTGLTLITIHGVGGNFYSSYLFRSCTATMLAQGASVLWTNNRGHDGLVNTPVGRRREQGAAYEYVSDCRLDIDAWQKWLKAHATSPKHVLWGHSLGAIKALYKTAHDPAVETVGVIANSPVLLSRRQFSSSPRAAEYQADLEKASRYVSEQRGHDLLHIRNPTPIWISAESYLDKYGPDEKYDFLNFIEPTRCPILFTYGEVELSDDPHDLKNQIAERVADGRSIEFCTIPRANHFYTQGIEDLQQKMEHWLVKHLASGGLHELQ